VYADWWPVCNCPPLGLRRRVHTRGTGMRIGFPISPKGIYAHWDALTLVFLERDTAQLNWVCTSSCHVVPLQRCNGRRRGTGACCCFLVDLHLHAQQKCTQQTEERVDETVQRKQKVHAVHGAREERRSITMCQRVLRFVYQSLMLNSFVANVGVIAKRQSHTT